MLSIDKIDAGQAAVGYADYQEKEVEKNREDYYSSEQDKGQWAGGLAGEMGLNGEIEKGQLIAMLQGYDPGTGEALAKNAGVKHKAGWDLTFSAPKTVSAVWAVSNPETRAAIEAAQQRAAAKALKFMEGHAFSSRDRRNNSPVDKVLAVMYQHGTSREKEPQFHTHCAIANLGLRPDGSACAIELDLRWKMAAGAVYRAELAREMQRLGLATERAGDNFRLVGVQQDLCDLWSTRRGQIKEELKRLGLHGAKASEVAALATRKVKDKELSPRSELFATWAAQAAEHGFTPDVIEQLRREVHAHGGDQAAGAELDPLSSEAIFAAVTENDSTFTEHKIYQAVAVAAQCRLDRAGIERRVAELIAERDLLKLQKLPTNEAEKIDSRSPRATEARYTTKEMWLLESALVERAGRMANDTAMTVAPGKAAAAINTFEAAKGFELNSEQRAALHHITCDTGQIALVRGAAGAGKTTMLEAAKIAWEADGYRVRGAALAGKAAAGMEQVGISSDTIAKLLLAEQRLTEAQQWNDKIQDGPAKLREKAAANLAAAQDAIIRKGDVLIIDEAGMVGSRDMAALASRCHAAGAKLVLVGDEKQLQAISAGGAFKMLQKSVGKLADLIENRRQKTAEDRQAATDTVEGRAGDALLSYLRRGKVTIEKTQSAAVKSLVSVWQSDPRAVKDKLILSATRANTRVLNDKIREGRLATGKLINNQTLATSTGKLDFAEGDRLIFLKNDTYLGIKNGHLGDIKRIEMTNVGQKVTVFAQDIGRDVSFLVGDKDDKDLVKAAKALGMSVYDRFDHGYAVTNHKSQGVTVAASYLLGLGDREMSYVQLTRHKEDCRIFLDAKTLQKAVEAAEADATDNPPTQKMTQVMEKIAEKKGVEAVATEGRSFRTVREWLDVHSDKELGYEAPESRKADDLAGVPDDLKEQMMRLKEACNAMSASHQKDTTQDYQIVQPGKKHNQELADTLALAAAEKTQTLEMEM